MTLGGERLAQLGRRPRLSLLPDSPVELLDLAGETSGVLQMPSTRAHCSGLSKLHLSCASRVRPRSRRSLETVDDPPHERP